MAYRIYIDLICLVENSDTLLNFKVNDPCGFSLFVPVHLKSIFTTGVSWKVTQVKTKFTLLTFVRSEEDDPLGLMPLNICLLYHLLWGLSQYFLLPGRVIVSEWGFKPSAKAQVLAPTITTYKVKVNIIHIIYLTFFLGVL